MVGMPVFDVLDEQGRHDFSRHLPVMIATGEPRDNLDAHFVRPDGSTFWGLVSYVPLHDDDGRRTGWLHRVTPYTERKELLDALATREHQLAVAQRIAKIGSWEWDLVEQHRDLVGRDVPDRRGRAGHPGRPRRPIAS